MRTTETTITFRRPFTLAALDKAQPAGTYRVATEEEEIDGLSFVAFRRRATLLYLPALSTASATQQVVNVDPLEWTAIIEADGRNRPKITTFQLSVASRTLGIRPPKTSTI